MKRFAQASGNRAVEKELMNDLAFEFATKGLRLAARTKEAARLIRVEGLSRAEAMNRTGVSSDTLSKALPRIQSNLKALLAEGDLVHSDWILPLELAQGITAVEARLLEPLLKDKKSRRKKQ